jgi:hypothetical protein
MFVQIQALRSGSHTTHRKTCHTATSSTSLCELLGRDEFFDRFPPQVEGQAARSGQNLAQHLHRS